MMKSDKEIFDTIADLFVDMADDIRNEKPIKFMVIATRENGEVKVLTSGFSPMEEAGWGQYLAFRALHKYPVAEKPHDA